MKRVSRRYRIVLIIFLFIAIIYYSPLGCVFFNRTIKNYFYSDDKRKHCLTVIGHGGNLLKGFIYNYQVDYGMGVYLIPRKFYGWLPKENYIRISYIGDKDPFYYKWTNDTLYLRIPGWKDRIIENKLPPNVKLDTLYLDYERWGMYDSDTTRNVEDRLEWRQMKNEYRSIDFFDLE